MLEDQFHFQLLKCFNHQKRWINQRTIQIDVLPGQSKVLQCLDEHGPLSPKEIGKLCIVDKSTTTSLLNKMEKMNGICEVRQDKEYFYIAIIFPEAASYSEEDHKRNVTKEYMESE